MRVTCTLYSDQFERIFSGTSFWWVFIEPLLWYIVCIPRSFTPPWKGIVFEENSDTSVWDFSEYSNSDCSLFISKK